jgi:hypothetical protein
MHQASKYAAAVIDSEQDMLDAARRANVSIYTVEPRGNTAGNEELMQGQLVLDPITHLTRPPATMGVMREAQRGQGTLRTLSSETGGIAVVGTDRFSAGFGRIVEANSAYYVLGYRPPPVEAAGRYRRIAVQVTSRDDVEINARRGYLSTTVARSDAAVLPTSRLALPADVSTRAKALLESEMPVRNGLDLRLAGGPIEPQGDKSLVALVFEIDGQSLPFSEHNGQLTNDLELAFIALDAVGAVQAGSRSLGHLVVPAAARESLAKGLRYVVEFAVQPGRYRIRMAAAESVENRGGSTFLDVDVPSFNKSPIAVATPLLTTSDAASVATSGAFPRLRAATSTPPITRRDFSHNETVLVIASVTGSEVTGGGTITASLLDDQGRDVQKELAPFTRADVDSTVPVMRRVIPVSLHNVPAGAYTLSVTATSATSSHTARQAVPITVR